MTNRDIEQSLDSSGWAQVLVVLEPAAAAPAPRAAAAVGMRSGIPRAAPTETSTVLQHFLDELPEAAATARTTASMATAAASAGPLEARVTGSTTCRRYHFARLGVALGFVDRSGHRGLSREPAVREMHSAEHRLSLIRPVRTQSSRHSARLTWGLRKLGIPKLWKQGLTGTGVRVGHLDTGIDGEHPALRNRIAEFLEVDLGGDRVAGASAYDSGDHGTHTAGTICGESVGGRAFGVAPGVELYSGLVIEGNPLVRVLEGMEWALEKEVRVLSMSLGFRGFNPFFVTVTQRLRQQGVLPVFAIGNEGRGTSRSPGNYPEAVSVGATDRRNRVASFSSSITFDRREEPEQPNLVAPGVSVISAKPGGGVQSMNGTSMATPHVAGVAALLFEAHPETNVEQVEHALQSTAKRLRRQRRTRFGFGLIDPAAALAALEETP